VVIGDLRLHPGYAYRDAGISRMRADVGGRERSLSASSQKQDGYSAAVGTSRLRAKYFRGENGAGIGASHQTGWAGTLALVFVLAGMLHLPLDAIAGVAS
jgi:hypothetical protein